MSSPPQAERPLLRRARSGGGPHRLILGRAALGLLLLGGTVLLLCGAGGGNVAGSLVDAQSGGSMKRRFGLNFPAGSRGGSVVEQETEEVQEEEFQRAIDELVLAVQDADALSASLVSSTAPGSSRRKHGKHEDRKKKNHYRLFQKLHFGSQAEGIRRVPASTSLFNCTATNSTKSPPSKTKEVEVEELPENVDDFSELSLLACPSTPQAVELQAAAEDSRFWIAHEIGPRQYSISPRTPPEADLLPCLQHVLFSTHLLFPSSSKSDKFHYQLPSPPQAASSGNGSYTFRVSRGLEIPRGQYILEVRLQFGRFAGEGGQRHGRSDGGGVQLERNGVEVVGILEPKLRTNETLHCREFADLPGFWKRGEFHATSSRTGQACRLIEFDLPSAYPDFSPHLLPSLALPTNETNTTTLLLPSIPISAPVTWLHFVGPISTLLLAEHIASAFGTGLDFRVGNSARRGSETINFRSFGGRYELGSILRKREKEDLGKVVAVMVRDEGVEPLLPPPGPEASTTHSYAVDELLHLTPKSPSTLVPPIVSSVILTVPETPLPLSQGLHLIVTHSWFESNITLEQEGKELLSLIPGGIEGKEGTLQEWLGRTTIEDQLPKELLELGIGSLTPNRTYILLAPPPTPTAVFSTYLTALFSSSVLSHSLLARARIRLFTIPHLYHSSDLERLTNPLISLLNQQLRAQPELKGRVIDTEGLSRSITGAMMLEGNGSKGGGRFEEGVYAMWGRVLWSELGWGR